MKRTLVIIALSAGTMVLSAQARIGETEAQCTVRYGKPLVRNDNHGLVTLLYDFSGFRVAVAILDGTSQAEGYSKLADGEPIAASEIQHLLEVNSAGRKWKSEKPTAHAPQVWKTDDSSRIAFYDVRNALNVRTATFETFANRDVELSSPSPSTCGF